MGPHCPYSSLCIRNLNLPRLITAARFQESRSYVPCTTRRRFLFCRRLSVWTNATVKYSRLRRRINISTTSRLASNGAYFGILVAKRSPDRNARCLRLHFVSLPYVEKMSTRDIVRSFSLPVWIKLAHASVNRQLGWRD